MEILRNRSRYWPAVSCRFAMKPEIGWKRVSFACQQRSGVVASGGPAETIIEAQPYG